MACARQRNANSFSILDSLNSSPPNELSQILPQRMLAKEIPPNPIPVHAKLQQNCNPQQPHPVHRRNGSTKPGFAGARGQRQGVLREKNPNCYPASVPPRFRNNPQLATKEFCNPTEPLQCSEPINPCLTPTLYSNDILTAELRKQLLTMKTQLAACPAIPAPMPQVVEPNSLCIQPIGPPIPPTQPVPILPGSNQNTARENNILSSTSTQRTADRQQPPQVASRTPTSAKPKEPPKERSASIPPPPGLSKREQPPHIPEVASRTPTSANPKEPPKGPSANIPPPPGLSKRVQRQPHIPEVAPRTPTITNPKEPRKELSTDIPPPPGLSKRVQQQPHIPEVAPHTSTCANPKEPPKEHIPPPPGLSRRVQQPPHIPEVAPRTPTSAPKEPPKELSANIPPPPGLSRRIQQSPHIPEIVSRTRTPTSAGDLVDPSEEVKVSIPPPPGVPRRGGRRGRFSNRGRVSTRPVNGERQFNQTAESSSFERHNGPMDTGRVISPPLSGTTPNFKLPPSKNAQPVPNSPATSVSSLTEDLSGSSSVRFSSDTTFTSVDSNVSDKVPQRPLFPPYICRKWMYGLPCYRVPCRFQHPPRPNQPADAAAQPPQPFSAPLNLSGAIKNPVDVEQRLGSNPGMRDPPNVNVELPRPDPLYATTISDHIKVRFDRGFEVRDVVTGFESRWVHIGNLAHTVTSAALNELLSPYKVDNIILNNLSGKPANAKVQFTTTEDAMKAVADLNGTEFLKRTIIAKLAINNSHRGGTVLTDTDVQVVWECPFRVGYAGYDTLKEARVALDTLNGAPLEYLMVTAQLYEGLPCVGAYNVMFKQLPASVTEQSLRKFAKSNAVMLERPNYQALDRAINSIRSRLEEYGTVTSFDVIPAPYRGGMVKAWARFTSPAEARAAQEDMDRRRPKAIGHTILTCRHLVSVSHVLSAASYRRMREDIGWLRWSWYRRYGPSVSIREKFNDNADEETSAFIRLSSEQPELLSVLKYEFEQLLHGETVTFSKKPAWDDFLVAEAGRAYIAQVQAQYPGIEIQVQTKKRVVSLWGPVVMRHRARQDIVRKIVELKAQQFWKIPLSGKLLGIFRSAELTTLQELLGAENCILDFAERVLVVRGNDLAFRIACDAVQAAQSRQSDEMPSSDTVCPVCFGEAVVPVSLACGHQWCRACLTGYLASAVENKMFPLKCLGNDATCSQCIPLGLSRKFLSADDFNAVIEAAFWVYVHSRPEEFHHCPTPDCAQVYRSAPPNSVLQCPSCLIRICPACHIEYHDDMTCEERDVAEDKLFKEWSVNHDVKSCPSCKVPIERSEGCNHMTCARCQTHICWECMATFPRGQGIYDHMRVQHGGIGL